MINHSRYGAPEFMGYPLKETFLLNCAVGIEDGQNMLYTLQTGRPPVFNVFDIDACRVVRSFPLSEDTHTCWTHKIDAEGNVYFATQATGRLYRYSPISKEVESLGYVLGESALYHICFDEERNVYVGTFPNAKIVKYDVKEKRFYDLGTVIEGEKYAMSMVYYKGFLYVGGNSASTSFYKVNVKSGEKERLKNPSISGVFDETQVRCYYMMTLVEHYLFAHTKLFDGTYVMLVYDLEQGRWLDFVLDKAFGHHVSPKLDGKVYLILEKRVKSFDLATCEIEETGMDYANYIMGGNWVRMKDQEKYPGNTYVTVNYDLGKPVLLNLQKKEVTVLENADFTDQPIEIRAMGTDPDGHIIFGGYMGTHGAVFDVATGDYRIFPIGQIEGMGTCGDKVYFGIYTQAQVHEFDPKLPIDTGNNPRFLRKIGEKQDRPFKVIEAEGKVVISSVPTYGELGGALTIFDPVGDTWAVYRNIVPNHSVISLAYRDGKIYASTCIWGGLGIDPIERDAKIFVFDLAKSQKVAEVTPKFPDFQDHLMHIGDISFGPDGLLWAVSKGFVFAMDPETLEIMKYRNINGYDWTVEGIRLVPICIRWGHDGLMYINANDTMAVFDIHSLDYKIIGGRATHFEIGKDGNLYYTDYSRLYRIDVSNTNEPVPGGKQI
ncbi:hypothetical protein [Paenibacillus contaminans]|uniref:WD40 repeat domain-containing protein n=1 Tax=Paenibacillus contaminans TaxID=450362 RepID=A0A329MCX3_9BACL|nr:hypothetical protein [Paenibacillus contaminans]RAV17422.1 hypothetical protein DQG23_27680 [Paenibacillus contaminans]